MISMTIKGDVEFQLLLKQVLSNGQNAQPVFNVLAQKLRGDALANFRGGGVFPQAWKPSKRVQKRGGQTLVDKAILRNSIHADSGADYARIGTDVIYAAVHQFGADIRIPARRQTNAFNLKGKFLSRAKAATWKRKSVKIWMGQIGAHTIHIPARPFMPVDAAGNLSPATGRFAVQTMANHLLRGAG